VLAQEDDGQNDEEVIFISGDDMEAWSMPALSSTAAAGLQELHLINANCRHHILDLQAVGSCINLTKLEIEDTFISSDDTALGALAPLTQLVELVLKVGQVWDLAPLRGCVQLKKLWVFLEDVTDLTQLQGLDLLTDLDISYTDYPYKDGRVLLTGLLSLEGLRCSQLHRFSMRHASVSTLAPLSAALSLEVLDISSCKRVSSLAPLSGCPVQDLDLSCTSVESLAGLPVCVQTLRMSSCKSVTSLQPLTTCNKLRTLSIRSCDLVRSVEPLAMCTSLTELDMSHCKLVSSVAPLSACLDLRNLDLSSCTAVESLSGLPACVQTLRMSSCTSLTSLEPLTTCALLNRVVMKGCSNVTSVEPLQGCALLEVLDIEGLGDLLGVAALKAARPQMRFDSWISF
jgi:Leucine-rich repeat (LRR) protein